MWEGLQERGGIYTKQELNMDMGRSRGSAKLSLIRRRRTTSRKNTTALRTSYLLKLLRSTRVRSKVNTAAEPSTYSRKPRIQWLPSDDKGWETFDEDLDKKILWQDMCTGSFHHCQQSCMQWAKNVLERLRQRMTKKEASPVNPIDVSKRYRH